MTRPVFFDPSEPFLSAVISVETSLVFRKQVVVFLRKWKHVSCSLDVYAEQIFWLMTSW